ncbi:LOW QUALITY PROTEIN: PAP_RNA-bind domain-containing protein/PAP_central domain-containing protein, partial [Cephalotus follicularis]
AKKAAWQCGLPKQEIVATCATILTYGSYGLGAHCSESDIDALCVGSSFTTMAKDYFIVLRNMLKSRPEVSEIHCVKDAKVAMRLKFDGITVDLPYAQLRVLSVPLVETLCLTLCLVKKKIPSLNLATVRCAKIFWTRSLMPIRLPCSPHEYGHSNITRSTFYKIRAEFLREHNMTRDILRPDFDWHSVFETFPYLKKYARFVKIYLSTSDKSELGDWIGWLRSRFRCLLVKLEEVQGLCDPNPTEYVDTEAGEPNVVFYWGL